MWRGGILTLNFEIFAFLSIIQCLNLSDENGAFIISTSFELFAYHFHFRLTQAISIFT